MYFGSCFFPRHLSKYFSFFYSDDKVLDHHVVQSVTESVKRIIREVGIAQDSPAVLNETLAHGDSPNLIEALAPKNLPLNKTTSIILRALNGTHP